jgi:hypothetical protein
MRQSAVVVFVTAALCSALLSGCSGAADEEGDTAASPTPASKRDLQIDDPPTIRSFTISKAATIESDETYETTTLRIAVTKVDNSIAGGMDIQIRFGETICSSRRPYLVYAADQLGGNLFAGDHGFHDLSCGPYVSPADLASLPTGRVE